MAVETRRSPSARILQVVVSRLFHEFGCQAPRLAIARRDAAHWHDGQNSGSRQPQIIG
jgi:hypothetical protein